MRGPNNRRDSIHIRPSKSPLTPPLTPETGGRGVRRTKTVDRSLYLFVEVSADGVDFT
jgi:hypothetical protein